MTKARLPKRLSTHPPESEQRRDVRDARVRVDGGMAVVNYLVSITEEGCGNAKLFFEFRRTEVFQKKNGTWLAIAARERILPINYRALCAWWPVCDE